MRDFYDVLDQVVALLRRRNRVTYRALKLQFKLDDEAPESLKDELLKAQCLGLCTCASGGGRAANLRP